MGGHQARIEGRERRARLRGAGASPSIRPLRPANGPPWSENAGKARAPDATMAATSASPASAGLSPASAANSRPPMKRAVGTGRPAHVDVGQHIGLRVEPAFPPTPMMMTQVPVEMTVNGSCLVTRWGTREAFEIVRAADDPYVGRKARRGGDFRAERSQRVPRVAQRRKEPPPAELLDHARQPALVRTPEIRVRADRRDLRRHDAAQAPGPILRIGEKGGSACEFGGKHALEIERLAPRLRPRGRCGDCASSNGGRAAS